MCFFSGWPCGIFLYQQTWHRLQTPWYQGAQHWLINEHHQTKHLPSYLSSDLDLATKSSKYFLQIHLCSVTNGEVKVCQLFDLICVFICILCKQFNKTNEIFSFCSSLTLSLQLKRRQYRQYTVIAIKRQPLPCWTQFQCMMIIWWYFKKSEKLLLNFKCIQAWMTFLLYRGDIRQWSWVWEKEIEKVFFKKYHQQCQIMIYKQHHYHQSILWFINSII